ncbi:MAG: hypothetical protein HKN95_02050, partial [Acidimicrobiia bacterium]|nr:hypothetical protein [Acidimicrobiia bacterium]
MIRYERNHSDRVEPISRSLLAFVLLVLCASVTWADDGLPTPLAKTIEASISAAGMSDAQRLELKQDVEAAVEGGADPALLARLIERAAETGIRPDDIGEIGRRARRLSARELPSEPVLDRYLQGFSKGIPLERIHLVADGIEERL